MKKIFFVLTILTLSTKISHAQIGVGSVYGQGVDYAKPKYYKVAGISVEGTQFLDKLTIQGLAGIDIGDEIMVPGEKTSDAVQKLWKQGLFTNVRIKIDKIESDNIFIIYELTERPRLSKFTLNGISKSQADDLREQIKLIRGTIVTEAKINSVKRSAKKYFVDKGYLNTAVNVVQEKDSTLANSIVLNINIRKGRKIRIHKIEFDGLAELKAKKLKSKMKGLKEKKIYRFLSASRYTRESLEKDKQIINDYYKSLGYRDMKIISDTMYSYNAHSVDVKFEIYEGNKYYFRNVTWSGNYKYDDDFLNRIMKIKKGDLYDKEVLDKRLNYNPQGADVSSLYMDNGYLFFNVTPVEVLVEGDSIDLEMRIYEGPQATIRKVEVEGNTKTHDHVIIRELRTLPGQKFSRADLIRSQRELAQLGYFDPEKINVVPTPNYEDGTVDLKYKVEEKASDQLTFQGGWGGVYGVVGTIGVAFNNFSTRNLFKKGGWHGTLPSGDGQKVALQVQLSGKFYQSYSASFTEPWLGGKKPNSLSFTGYYSVRQQGKRNDPDRTFLGISGLSVSLGRRLKFPDDYFTMSHFISAKNYHLINYPGIFTISDGDVNVLSVGQIIARNSTDQPIYPRTGSTLSLSIEATPPYSLFTKNLDAIRDNWVEFHKWKFEAGWFTPITKNLVLHAEAQFGFLGLYTRSLGLSPFERFYLGGSGLNYYNLDGRDIIGLRGYGDNVFPEFANGTGGTIFDKFTLELRYPVSLNPSATVFLIGFAEAGNAWTRFRDFNPYQLHRSAGVGVRIFLPMFGLIGLDLGFGLDGPDYQKLYQKLQFKFGQ